MRFRRSIPIPLILLSFLIASRSENRPQDAEKKPTIGRTAIFAVGAGSDGVKIDPIVILDRGRYLQPPDGVDHLNGRFHDTPQSRKFAADYYRSGRTYQLLFGGGRIGTATVTGRTSRMCISLAASVRLETSRKIGGWVMALAADSDSLGLPESSRRALLPDERAIVLSVVRRIYSRKGISLVDNRITVTNLTAVDLNRDSNPEIVGSFRIEREDKAYLLFLIIEPSEGRYRIALQRYSEGRERGEDFVDELDLDGDGIGEVITQLSGSETWQYYIYKRRAGGWQIIYNGGGGGC